MYCTWYVHNAEVDSDRSIGTVRSEHVFSYSYQLFEMASTDVKRNSIILKAVWLAVIMYSQMYVLHSEILHISKEAGNTHDQRAVAVFKADRTIVGHVPREFSRVGYFGSSIVRLWYRNVLLTPPVNIPICNLSSMWYTLVYPQMLRKSYKFVLYH